jgi:fructose-bisphosphate aldolase class I
LGACFTKWRAVISIGAELPTRGCLLTNARLLALYAAMSQAAGLVPIVEPEVLMDGDHTLERCEEVITRTLTALFEAIVEQRVALERMILKSGMVLSGSECQEQADDAKVTEATLRTFRRTVPAAVPGIVFLSGGQDDVPATRRLNEIARRNPGPWKITFSYGRALQNPSLKAWAGREENIAAGQAALHHRALCNGKAAQGQYTEAVEKQA